MNHPERGQSANERICETAKERYGGRMYLTAPTVEESKKDAVFPPAAQNEEDTREWCAMHET